MNENMKIADNKVRNSNYLNECILQLTFDCLLGSSRDIIPYELVKP